MFCIKDIFNKFGRKNRLMILPICSFDAKNTILCPKCESKVESGRLSRADIDASFILAKLAKESPQIESFSLNKCKKIDDNYIIHLDKNDILAIRQSKTLYGLIQDQFKAKIWLVESKESDKRFIEDLFFPIKILSINSVWVPDGVQKTKVIVLGRWTQRFPIDLDKVKQIVKNMRDLDIDIEFEDVQK